MDTIDKIVKAIGSSREMAGYSIFNVHQLENLKVLLNEFKEEIKTELKSGLNK